MKPENPSQKILKILLKDISIVPTITFLAKELGLSRVGTWKILKKLESENVINLNPIGKGKTSTYIVNLNFDNPITEKMLSLALTEDAIKNQRWMNNFAELNDKLDFLILYGSILYSSQDANDIDIIGVVSDKKMFKEIDTIISKIQKVQIKKIHAINFIPEELKQEIKKSNKAIVDAIKKGIILLGQDNFIRFMKSINRK